MKVDVSDLLKGTSSMMKLDLSDEISDEVFAEYHVSFSSPVRLKGTLTNNNGILSLDGALEVPYNTVCYRCLEDISSNMSIEIREAFINPKLNDASDEQYLYGGDILELDGAVRDNILLNLPLSHVCNEECRGLCQVCGTNLNNSTCTCEQEDLDPRLQVLKDLK